MKCGAGVILLMVIALAGLLLASFRGPAPAQVASALPPAVQRTPPPPAAIPPSVPTRAPE